MLKDVSNSVSRVPSHGDIPIGVVKQAVANRRCMRNFATILFAFLKLALCVAVWVAVPAFAKVHPVPLEKNVDSASCLQCHEEKSKGKSVHSAIQMGCLSCHEVRVNKDVTRVKLITAVPYKLCFNCHAEKDAAQIKGHVHEPAVRDCLSCHDPHTSNNKNQLLKATSGE